MHQDAKFWNRMAKGYAKSKIGDMPSYERKLEITQGYFTPDMEVLEIGCGTGTTALKHAPHVKHIRATDVSSEMIAIAKSKADAAGVTNVSFEVSAIDELQVAPGSQDMVMAHSILHLLDNRTDVIRQCFDMLKPGGLLVTSTVCLKDGMGWVKFLLPVMRLVRYAPPVLEFFSADELEKDFTDAGFQVAYKWRPGPKKAIFMVLRKPE